jgi:P22 coat protein - gene protein 5
MPLTAEVFTRMVGKIALASRENCLGPRSINMDYASDLEERGNTINIPLTSTVPVRDIVAANIPPATTPEPTPNTVPVTLDNHKEAAFKLTDRDLSGLDNPESWISRQLDEAGRAIANAVDGSILQLYRSVPHRVGVAGTTPFSTSTLELQQAERTLIANVAPPGTRKLLLDPFAHTNALGLPGFQNAMAFGDNKVIKDGMITRALGFDWGYSQNVAQHTRGIATGAPTTNGVQAAGTVNLLTTGWTVSVTNILRAGDIITIAGDANPYVVTADVSSNPAGNATVPISNGFSQFTPGLLIVCGATSVITVLASHRANLAVHPDFGAFASRKLASLTKPGAVAYKTTWSDPISGLVLDIRITEQYYQSEFSVSCLWGTRVIKPEFACRILG